MKAIKNTERYELDGQVVECSLAKPQADQNTSGGSSSQNSGFLPNWVWSGWGCLWCFRSSIRCCRPSTGADGCLIAIKFSVLILLIEQSSERKSDIKNLQPLIYGKGATTIGMSMVPMLLPDGQIGYVLQPPGAQQPQSPPVHQRHSRGGGSSSSRGKHGGSDSGHIDLLVLECIISACSAHRLLNLYDLADIHIFMFRGDFPSFFFG